MRRVGTVVAAVCVAGCAVSGGTRMSGSPPAPAPIAVTSRMDGSLAIIDRDLLQVLREIPAAKVGGSTWPMQAVADPARRAFYVGNFDGMLARVPFAGGDIAKLELGGPVAGLAIDPSGKRLAITGVKDLVLRLVDLDGWKMAATVSFGDAGDVPKRGSLTHGLASPHPVWLADGSAVVVQDNVHEELVLVSPDGKVITRRAMKSPVHTVIVAQDGTLLAIGEGAPDGSARAHVAVLAPKSLEPIREIEVPLAQGEPATLHHGSLSPDGTVLVVANRGPVKGEPGTTVAALRWQTGEVLWSASVLRTAAHVKFLDAGRVIVLGHRAAELKVLEAATGAELATWDTMGTASLGHALDVHGGEVTVLDGTLGRVLRFRNGELVAESPRVGDGYAESSLDE